MKHTIKKYHFFLLLVLMAGMLLPTVWAQVGVKAVNFSTLIVFPGDEVKIQ